jgi:hypothetical protein
VRGIRPIRDQIARWKLDVANPKRRIPLGWPQLDKIVRGPAPGEVFTLLAASHVGKSLFATNVMANNPDAPIIFFSLEMPEHQVLGNLVAHVFDMPGVDLEDMEHRQELPDFIDELPNRLPMQVVVDDDGLTFEEMGAYLEDFESWYGERPSLAIIDYLEEVGGAKASGEGYLRTEAAAAAAKAWAKRHRIGVLLLHQTKHGTKQWEPPTKQDVKSAGYTEADVVLGAWRPGWNPSLATRLDISEVSERESLLSINVLKNRVRGIREEELTFRIDPAKRIVETWLAPANHYAESQRFFFDD